MRCRSTVSQLKFLCRPLICHAVWRVVLSTCRCRILSLVLLHFWFIISEKLSTGEYQRKDLFALEVGWRPSGRTCVRSHVTECGPRARIVSKREIIWSSVIRFYLNRETFPFRSEIIDALRARSLGQKHFIFNYFMFDSSHRLVGCVHGIRAERQISKLLILMLSNILHAWEKQIVKTNHKR